MKIVINVDDSQIYGLSPANVYRRLRDEHYKNLRAKYENYFWGMEDACDKNARELYAKLTNRASSVKNLILTYSDAQACFKVYEKFVNVWVSEITC